MRLLLDTQIIWWLLVEPQYLRQGLDDQLRDASNMLFYTPLSLFELAIKRAKGGITFEDNSFVAGMTRWRMQEVPLRREHALVAGGLPPIHKDPFDRLIIAQAITERMTLVSADKAFPRYDVRLIAG